MSLLSAFIFNEINIYQLQKDGKELRFSETVVTADDVSYINPAFSYLHTGEFKNNIPGNGAYFLRPPGYSMVFLSIGSIVEEQTVFKLVKYLQLILFSVSIYFLYIVAILVLRSKPVAVLVTLIYGVSGIASGFLYYTLTEGVTPALVIFYVFNLMKIYNEEAGREIFFRHLYAAVFLAIIFITRPVLGILGLALPVSIYFHYKRNLKKLFLYLLFFGFVASSAMVIWQIRNWKIAGKYVGLHPIYYAENGSSCFRPPHEAFWKFCSTWGEIGANFHGYAVPFWQSVINGDTTSVPVDMLIDALPEYVQKHFGRERLMSVFRAYQKSIVEQQYYYHNKLPMPKIVPQSEREVIEEFHKLTAEFKTYFWYEYYFFSPLKVFREQAFHSNLSLYIFQKTFRGNLLMEILRMLCFLIHSIAFTMLILSLCLKRSVVDKTIFSISLIIYVGYLIYVQRGVEERYTLPILSLVLITSADVIHSVYLYVKRIIKPMFVKKY